MFSDFDDCECLEGAWSDKPQVPTVRMWCFLLYETRFVGTWKDITEVGFHLGMA